MTNINSPQTYSPGLLSMIPLLYVGWADSVLSPSEVKLIRQKINEFSFLTKEDKKYLKQWSNPENPPSEQVFREWVNLIKSHTEAMDDSKKNSLAALAIDMARKNAGNANELDQFSTQTKEALEELEDALGVGNLENYRNIFPNSKFGNDHAVADFDIAKMTLLLDGEYHELRNKMRTLLADPSFSIKEHIADKDAFRYKVLEWCHQLAEQGLGGRAFPKAYGGNDSMGEYAEIFEMMAHHDLSLTIKFGVHFGLFGGSVLWLGTEKHHKKYLNDIVTLALPGCFAMTETGHGSNVRELQTTATYDHKTKELVIQTPTENDGKEYIGNALHGTMASVFAQLIVDGKNHGVHAILVPLKDKEHQLLPGVRVEDCGYKLGLNGVDNGRIWFNQVRVSKENLLNRFGDINEEGQYTSPIENPSRRFFTMLGTLVGGRVCVPRAGLSAAKTGLTIAIKYALKRRQFGPGNNQPETLILDYPSHQRRLMPLLAKSYALTFGLKYLTERYVDRSEEDIREIETLAAGLKSYATWFTTACLQECREACGGKGYLAENRFAALKADSDIFTTFEGDNTVLMQLVAKGLLSSFKEEFHNEGFRGVIKFLAGRIGTSVTELNPYVIRKTDTTHLLDKDFQIQAFEYRERATLISVSSRMRNLLKKRITPYDAFLRCQSQLLVLAEAFVEKIVLSAFITKVNATEDPALKKQLKLMCDLYALHTMEKHAGWYLEAGYFEGAKSKAIRKLVDKLCADLRSNALFLVEAFGIPEASIAAPIV